jgi:hypothetical protein
MNRSKPACRFNSCRLESEELNNQFPVRLGRAILVLLPFFDSSVRDADVQHFGQFAL